jgi:hypothetical protein
MKNLNHPIWNRTRDLPACSVVPQSNGPPRASLLEVLHYVYLIFINSYDSRCSNYDADWTIQGSDPVRSNRCVSSPKRVDILWVPLNLLSNWYRWLMAGHKKSACDQHHMTAAVPLKKKCGTCWLEADWAQTRCGRFWEDKNLLSFQGLRTVQPAD